MKLKNGFVTHNTGGKQILVSANGEFNGLAKSNATAAFIIDCLKEETTEEIIVDSMLALYDAPRDVIERDVKRVIDTLRSINALE